MLRGARSERASKPLSSRVSVVREDNNPVEIGSCNLCRPLREALNEVRNSQLPAILTIFTLVNF